MYSLFFKRFFDLIFSFSLMILLFPVLAIVAILLALGQKGNPFFTQIRPGRNGKLFRLIKFKTMKEAFDREGKPLPDEERLTAIGKLVRKTSIDELPQLTNVFLGDMSLIGPRPLLMEYLPLYNSEQSKRHLVRPGITGWAQVNGRNTLSWQRKFEFDVWYVNNLSLSLDLKILGLTLVKVFKSEGITQSGHVSMTKFEGNK